MRVMRDEHLLRMAQPASRCHLLDGSPASHGACRQKRLDAEDRKAPGQVLVRTSTKAGCNAATRRACGAPVTAQVRLQEEQPRSLWQRGDRHAGRSRYTYGGARRLQRGKQLALVDKGQI